MLKAGICKDSAGLGFLLIFRENYGAKVWLEFLGSYTTSSLHFPTPRVEMLLWHFSMWLPGIGTVCLGAQQNSELGEGPELQQDSRTGNRTQEWHGGNARKALHIPWTHIPWRAGAERWEQFQWVTSDQLITQLTSSLPLWLLLPSATWISWEAKATSSHRSLEGGSLPGCCNLLVPDLHSSPSSADACSRECSFSPLCNYWAQTLAFNYKNKVPIKNEILRSLITKDFRKALWSYLQRPTTQTPLTWHVNLGTHLLSFSRVLPPCLQFLLRFDL